VFNKKGICTLDEIEYDPDAGCLTMEPQEDLDENEEAEWEEDAEDMEEADLDEGEDEEEWDEDEY
jgi:hypothetical protein